MSKNLKKISSSTEPVTIRLHKSHIARLENEAAAAMMSRAAYIQARLLDHEIQFCPQLSALAKLVSIHALVERAGATNDAQLDELKSLVLILARSAHVEDQTLT